MNQLTLSIVIPAYNEQENIKQTIIEILNVLQKEKIPSEIVVVNDNSKDNTPEVVKEIQKDYTSVKLVNRTPPGGFGRAIRTGLQNFSGDVVIIVMADLSDDPNDIVKYYRKIEEGYDIVIASRYNSLSKTYGLNYTRKILSFVSCILFKIFFPIKNINDYTCGFRAFKINKLKDIMLKKNFFSEVGFSVSADILLKLKLSNIQLSYAEIPLILRYDLKQGQSKMKIIKTTYQTLKLIILRRFFYLTMVKL
jgi:dolichol-phosphate mannosyltransferase